MVPGPSLWGVQDFSFTVVNKNPFWFFGVGEGLLPFRSRPDSHPDTTFPLDTRYTGSGLVPEMSRLCGSNKNLDQLGTRTGVS